MVGLRSVGFFFVKQKTAYEMRISDWSSDVCSSDLIASGLTGTVGIPQNPDTDTPLLVDDSPSGVANDRSVTIRGNGYLVAFDTNNPALAFPDRKSVV